MCEEKVFGVCIAIIIEIQNELNLTHSGKRTLRTHFKASVVL